MKNLRLLLAMVLVLLVGAAQEVSAQADFNSNRTDFRDETIYFAMTTRFYDGDPTNNVLSWDKQDVQISKNDPDWRGDFAGLIEKLDYIKALGFTAIWITPVVQNASGEDYHGYHAMDFSSVDLRYESRTEWGASRDVKFQDLIDAAHAKGIKIILDIVLNHTGNFGEAYLNPLFTRSQNIKDQASVSASIEPNYERLPANYDELDGTAQYAARFKYFKNPDYDPHNHYHHYGTGWNWDLPNRWWGQIAGDCVDLNTENDAVAEYLVKCYGEFIKMGVDGFRIDTTGHISRLTFNTQFIPQFTALGEQYKSKRLNECPFYMFGECCARFGEVIYRNQHNLSSHFYTWKSEQSLMDEFNAQSSQEYWDTQNLPEGHDSPVGPMATCEKETAFDKNSDNVFMENGAWHEPDYSEASGFNVIDFPMHYNFNNAGQAVGIAKQGDHYYNDASFNVVYVDSHDYCPGPNDGTRFNGGTEQWAENLSLMFTFRGIPCIYYGSEVEFKKGMPIDVGGENNKTPRSQSGRAYFGEYLKGNVTATGFGEFTADGNVAQTLNGDLSQHIIRLNKIRQAVPALRKGQYTWDGCTAASGGYAFKRAYKESYALVAINGGATFTDVPAGSYVDLVTGTKYTPNSGSITVEAPANQGQLRVLVKDWTGGKVGEDGKFIYASAPVAHGGAVEFDDPGTTSYYTAADAPGKPKVEFDPAGGAFKTDDITVTATLNESAVSGWYQIGETGGKKELVGSGSSTTFTLGGDMGYGETVTVYYGATDENNTEKTGQVTYKKVDPNATITVYCKAASAPYLYVWSTSTGSTVKLNGEWPGAQMSSTATVNGEEFYYMTFADVDEINVIFSNGSSQTGDLTGIDADIYYEYDGGTTATDITSAIPVDPSDVKVTATQKSGTYYQSVDVTLKASKNDAVIVYTTNGNEPTASSEQATGSKSFTFTETTTLKAGALVDGVVKNVVTYVYTITNEEPSAVKVYYDNANNWSDVYIYVYVNDGAEKNGEWPGKPMTYDASLTINGKTGWWVYEVPDNLKTGQVIVNNNNRGSQYPGANQDGLSLGGKSMVLTGTAWSELVSTGLGNVVTPTANVYRVYTLDGRAINNVRSVKDLGKGVYIVNGRKLVIR